MHLDDGLELIEQVIKKTPSYYSKYVKSELKQQREFRYKVLDFISEVKRKLLSEDELLKENDDEDIVLLYTTYQDILNSQNAIDFDDLIPGTNAKSLRGTPWDGSDHGQHAVPDVEADTDALVFALKSLLHALVVVRLDVAAMGIQPG